MVKKDLVDGLVALLPGISKKDMRLCVDAMFDTMARALERNEPVDLRGFGRLKLKKRRSRQARNPRTGVHVTVPERWVIHFKPSEGLARLVNVESVPQDPSVTEGSEHGSS
jgi:nucleoid DNA-binding protein